MIAAAPIRVPADSFTPVTLTTTIAPVLHVGSKVPIKVKVTADAGVLDTRNSSLKVEVALANECEGTFAQTETVGSPVMNRPLPTQPVSGQAYSATAATTWRGPSRRGTQTVCVWLVEESDQRVFASDQSLSVRVDKARSTTATKTTKEKAT